MNSVTIVLSLAPTNKVYETLFEMWSDLHSSQTHMEVYGNEDYAHCEALDNLESKIEICHLVGYPRKTFG